MIILFIIKMKILVLTKWSYEFPHFVSIEPTLVLIF
jgi:hypothetical protein